MFVVDFIAACLLAFVLTVGFAAIVTAGRYRQVRDLSAGIWLTAVASWLGGILIVAFGPALTGTHWLPFAVTGLLVGLLVLALRRVPRLRASVYGENPEPQGDARPAIAFYFCVTLLLLFCAISLRFYIVNLA